MMNFQGCIFFSLLLINGIHSIPKPLDTVNINFYMDEDKAVPSKPFPSGEDPMDQFPSDKDPMDQYPSDGVPMDQNPSRGVPMDVGGGQVGGAGDKGAGEGAAGEGEGGEEVEEEKAKGEGAAGEVGAGEEATGKGAAGEEEAGEGGASASASASSTGEELGPKTISICNDSEMKMNVTVIFSGSLICDPLEMGHLLPPNECEEVSTSKIFCLIKRVDAFFTEDKKRKECTPFTHIGSFGKEFKVISEGTGCAVLPKEAEEEKAKGEGAAGEEAEGKGAAGEEEVGEGAAEEEAVLPK